MNDILVEHGVCPICGSKNTTETIETQKIQLGDIIWTDDVREITIEGVPVGHCGDCNFDWTDYRADDIREAAVKKELEVRPFTGARKDG